MKWHYKVFLLLCTFALGSSALLTSPAEAQKGRGRYDKKNDSSNTEVQRVNRSRTTTTTTTTPVTTTTTTSTVTLSPYQRTQIIEIIRGTSTYSYLISDDIREQIYIQRSSLPPGIRKNLARGKGLPPGIAKKVLLPRNVVSHLNLPSNTNIIVIGSNIVVIDPISNLVLDILANIF
ncbi:hypothetical protein H6F41_05440 [Pseudanabaena sp. FACHB-723]|uniref:DUF1236 domain-containing protein n=1 Tax=Pseudanabaena mucicola FACHB-723 TaxID=2692860 RepID=A0ABR7ZVK7_9CYAN|nr:hypothetical protein [Pseudanabaena mucicola]MBD2187587.1 hypothetical protein [Pseudanabaena mucicola FACHB-723]